MLSACCSLPPQPIGSLLIAGSREEGEALAQRCEMLGRAGVAGAQLLTAGEARRLEPALQLANEGSALLLPSDVQASADVDRCMWCMCWVAGGQAARWNRAAGGAHPRSCKPACQLPGLFRERATPPTLMQVSCKATAAALLRACEAHGPRFTALFNEGARRLLQGDSGRVCGVATEERR